jgi:hypothetical protein
MVETCLEVLGICGTTRGPLGYGAILTGLLRTSLEYTPSYKLLYWVLD